MIIINTIAACLMIVNIVFILALLVLLFRDSIKQNQKAMLLFLLIYFMLSIITNIVVLQIGGLL